MTIRLSDQAWEAAGKAVSGQLRKGRRKHVLESGLMHLTFCIEQGKGLKPAKYTQVRLQNVSLAFGLL